MVDICDNQRRRPLDYFIDRKLSGSESSIDESCEEFEVGVTVGIRMVGIIGLTG